MTIHWLYLLGGLFFALIPGKYLRRSECRHFEYDQLARRMSDKSQRRRRWWKLPAVWIDPARAYIAVIMLLQGLQNDPETIDYRRIFPSLIIMAILTFGLSLQTIGSRSKSQLVAPVGYLGGMILAWMPPEVAIPALILGMASAVAFRRWSVGLFMSAACVVVLGYVFMGPKPQVAWAGLMLFWPVLVAYFKRRTLVLPVRI